MTITINGTGTITGAATLTTTIASPTLTSPTITGAVVSTMASTVISSGASVASTSGTSIDFTSIPSWVKRVTVLFAGVSTSGTSNLLLQIGSGSVTTSGYVSAASQSTDVASTAGFLQTSTITAAQIRVGTASINLLGSNIYVCSGVLADTTTTAAVARSGGFVTLGGALDRVRITTVNGTDTFDAGTINILYE